MQRPINPAYTKVLEMAGRTVCPAADLPAAAPRPAQPEESVEELPAAAEQQQSELLSEMSPRSPRNPAMRARSGSRTVSPRSPRLHKALTDEDPKDEARAARVGEFSPPPSPASTGSPRGAGVSPGVKASRATASVAQVKLEKVEMRLDALRHRALAGSGALSSVETDCVDGAMAQLMLLERQLADMPSKEPPARRWTASES